MSSSYFRVTLADCQNCECGTNQSCGHLIFRAKFHIIILLIVTLIIHVLIYFVSVFPFTLCVLLQFVISYADLLLHQLQNLSCRSK